MTARIAAATISVASALTLAACQGFYQIPVEIPVQSKINVSSFQRVLVAGFLTGGSKNIDPNTETARLLKSQLRSKQDLRVIDADVLPLMADASKRYGPSATAHATTPSVPNASGPSVPAPPPDGNASGASPSSSGSSSSNGTTLTNAALTSAATDDTSSEETTAEKALQRYEQIFSDKDYWKQIGEQYQSPLIVTGTIVFTEIEKRGVVTRPQPYMDSEGVEQYRSVREFSDQKGFAITPKFVFIDGHTGAQLYSETYHEEALYPQGQDTPALSSYFELMDKVLPSFLNTLSSQKIKGTRVLLK